LVAQGFDRVEARRAAGREITEDDSDPGGEQEGHGDDRRIGRKRDGEKARRQKRPAYRYDPQVAMSGEND